VIVTSSPAATMASREAKWVLASKAAMVATLISGFVSLGLTFWL